MSAFVLYRLGNQLHRLGVPVLPRLIEIVNRMIFRCVIPSSCTIGSGSVLAYGGIGVVLHKSTVIGARCLIGQGITIGSSEAYATSAETRCPSIGNDVYLAAGCRILGPIHIGDRCVVGANAVVRGDVARGSIVAGVPARIVGATEPDYRAIRA